MTDAPPDAKRRKRRGVVRRLSVLALLLVVGVVFVQFAGCAESLFFWPDRTAFATPAGVEDVEFTNAEGLTLHGWFIPPRRGHDPSDGPPPAVLHVHGNAGGIPSHIDFCDFLADEGFAVFIFDYRSYGRSQDVGRQLRREHLIADADAALDALMARDDIDHDRVGVFGFSIGSVTTLAMVAERPDGEAPRSVVVGAPFSTWRSVASDFVPIAPRLLLRTGADAVETVTRIGDRPLLIVHGTADPVVRPYHTERIEQAARDAGIDVQRVTFEGREHNDLLLDPEVRGVVAAFLHETLDGS